MSIKVTTRVWENSTACDGALLVLLAIADHANDLGVAWPGIDLLARKSRLTTRHVTRCLKKLAASNELQIQYNQGPNGANLYQVRCFPLANNMSALPTKSQDDKSLQGDTCVRQMSPEPSEPSESPTHIHASTAPIQTSSEWPTEEEVINYTQTYPGNSALGVPANAITREWASDYWTWRTYDEEHWPKRWNEELIRRFEREWRNGGSDARGQKKNLRAENLRAAKRNSISPSVMAIQAENRTRELAAKVRTLEDEIHQNRASNMPFDPKQMQQLKKLRAELEAARASESQGRA